MPVRTEAAKGAVEVCLDIFATTGISIDEFFRICWRRRPLLLRGALEGFTDPLDADELAGLAMEDEVESRLVRESGGKRPWQVQHGPLPEEELRTLPPAGWSLLVQGADRLLPELAELTAAFAFLPRWLFDDVMVSFAPAGASVGAHVDQYDVFIVQGSGTRLWRLGAEVPAKPGPVRATGDLRLLADFRPDHEWLLQPGDALYIPMGVPHHGITERPGLSYSVGFRPPDRNRLLAFLGHPGQDEADVFFREVCHRSLPGEIGAELLAGLRRFTGLSQADTGDGELAAGFARMVTWRGEEFFGGDSGGDGLPVAAPGLRRVWYRDDKEVVLVVEGESCRLRGADAVDKAVALCRQQELPLSCVSDPGPWLLARGYYGDPDH